MAEVGSSGSKIMMRTGDLAGDMMGLLLPSSGGLRPSARCAWKAELKKMIAGTDVQFSESLEVDGQEMLAHACKVGLEGVVSNVRQHLSSGAKQRLGEEALLRSGRR
jgi:hypothetical protein